MMKTTLLISTITLLSAGLPFAGGSPSHLHPQPLRTTLEEEHVDVRDLVGRAGISLHDAILKALAAQPGKAVEAELEGERDDDEVEVFFEVLVLSEAGELIEVRLSPKDGKVLSRSEAEHDEDETPGFVAALRHSECDLNQLVTAAEGYVKGVPVKAALEYEDHMPVATVAFVNGRHVIEVEVEARAGHLVEVELVEEAVGEPRDRGERAQADEGEEREEHEAGEESEEREHGGDR